MPDSTLTAAGQRVSLLCLTAGGPHPIQHCPEPNTTT
jgi:hypothetical protein